MFPYRGTSDNAEIKASPFFSLLATSPEASVFALTLGYCQAVFLSPSQCFATSRCQAGAQLQHILGWSRSCCTPGGCLPCLSALPSCSCSLPAAPSWAFWTRLLTGHRGRWLRFLAGGWCVAGSREEWMRAKQKRQALSQTGSAGDRIMLLSWWNLNLGVYQLSTVGWELEMDDTYQRECLGGSCPELPCTVGTRFS